MVNTEDAKKIAVDTALSVAAARAIGMQKSMKHTIWENAVNSTIYHYALREHVEAFSGAKAVRAVSKAAVLAALSVLQNWADGSAIVPSRVLVYAASQAAGEYVPI